MDKRSVRVRPVERTEADLVEAIRADEEATGRIMTPSEREGFARGFFAPEYVRETRTREYLRAMMLLDEDDE